MLISASYCCVRRILATNCFRFSSSFDSLCSSLRSSGRGTANFLAALPVLR
jgi:hypothetical protein